MGLPLEFLIPYEPKDLLKDTVNVFDVKSHSLLLDIVRTEGVGYLDCFIEAKMKKQKKKEKLDMMKAKQTGFQIKRMIKATSKLEDMIIEEPLEEPLSSSFTDQESLQRESSMK